MSLSFSKTPTTTVRSWDNRSFNGTKYTSFNREDGRTSFPVKTVFPKLSESKGKHQNLHAFRPLGFIDGFIRTYFYGESIKVGDFISVTKDNGNGLEFEGLVINRSYWRMHLLTKRGIEIIKLSDLSGLTLLSREWALKIWNEIVAIPAEKYPDLYETWLKFEVQLADDLIKKEYKKLEQLAALLKSQDSHQETADAAVDPKKLPPKLAEKTSNVQQ